MEYSILLMNFVLTANYYLCTWFTALTIIHCESPLLSSFFVVFSCSTTLMLYIKTKQLVDFTGVGEHRELLVLSQLSLSLTMKRNISCFIFPRFVEDLFY